MSGRREGDRHMNRHGTCVQARWRAYQPEDYLRIPSRERTAFFARPGKDTGAAIGRRPQELTDQEGPDTVIGFQARYALLSTLGHAAGQDVLAQMLPARPARHRRRPGGHDPAAPAGKGR